MDAWMDAAHRGLTALSESNSAAVQARGNVDTEDPASVHAAAVAGVSGTGSTLPHLDRIQTAFGAHDLSHVRAYVGGEAAAANEHMGAAAYATGDHIAFRNQPDLHTTAHEAAHVVQQRAGVQLDNGLGRAGDAYERNADAVADAVVRGESATSLLGIEGCSHDTTAMQAAVQQRTAGTARSHSAHTAAQTARRAARPNEFLSIANYMAGEMKGNAQGNVAQEIREKMQIDDIWDLWVPKLGLDKYGGLRQWERMVKANSTWDHKPMIACSWGQWSKDPKTNTWFYYDIWSNIHYGFVGRACKIHEKILLVGAGLKDDPRDKTAIKIGFDLWDKYKVGVNRKNLIDSIRLHASQLRLTGATPHERDGANCLDEDEH